MEFTESDLSALLSAMDSRLGDPNWNPAADLDGDGEVTSTDLAIVLAHLDTMGAL